MGKNRKKNNTVIDEEYVPTYKKKEKNKEKVVDSFTDEEFFSYISDKEKNKQRRMYKNKDKEKAFRKKKDAFID